MVSIKWKQINWIVYFKPHPFNCGKVGRVEISSNFFLLLSLISDSLTRFEHVFLKTIHQKWKYYREEKGDFERFLIFLNIKLLAKLNKIELSREFIFMWRERTYPLRSHVPFLSRQK